MTAPATSMLSAKLKMAQIETDRIDVKMDEIPDVSISQAVVAVPQRTAMIKAKATVRTMLDAAPMKKSQ